MAPARSNSARALTSAELLKLRERAYPALGTLTGIQVTRRDGNARTVLRSAAAVASGMRLDIEFQDGHVGAVASTGAIGARADVDGIASQDFCAPSRSRSTSRGIRDDARRIPEGRPIQRVFGGRSPRVLHRSTRTGRNHERSTPARMRRATAIRKAMPIPRQERAVTGEDRQA